ncbi:MAG TPA: restriction endonuclease subunit S [Phycisphaerales bacterium]
MGEHSWDSVQLGELVGIKHGWPFKSELFSEELTGRPIVVAVGNFQYTGGFRFDSTNVKEYLGEYPVDYDLLPGDVLLVMTCQTSGGEILGIPARVPNDGRRYLHNQRLGKVVVKQPKRVSLDYLYWLFLWKDFNTELVASSSGTKIVHTAPTRIEAFRFDLPPLPEQRAIARVLGALDDKIELNRRMNRTLEDLARGVFRSWFVDFDPVVKPSKGFAGPCKGLAGSGSPRPSSGGGSVPLASPSAGAAPADLFPKRLVDSPLGPIPEGWRVGTVGEEFNLTMGQSPPGSTYNEDGAGVPFYQGRTDFGFRFPTRRVYCTAPTRFAESGDTLVSVRAPVGDINMADERCAAGRGVAAVRHKSGATSYTYAMMAALREAFDVFNGDGTLFGCIGKSDFDKMQVLVPPPEMVAAFERIAGPWDAQITVNEKEARSLAATRDALLPVLLSGEVRLRNEREAERAVGDVLRSTATSTPPERPARPGAGTVHAGAKGGA